MHELLTELERRCVEIAYIADAGLLTAVALMQKLQRPLLVEGEAGTGKTELARALAQIRQCTLIRLQCYEGLDSNAAMYEWNYARQLLSIKQWEGSGDGRGWQADIFSEEFLLERPLLQAIRQESPSVLLIDEIDRADEAFEAYLLELLSDFQITIPEIGTLRARVTPLVILTSNASRELSDALRRRCLYHHMDYPEPKRELEIIHARLPGLDRMLAVQVVQFVHRVRALDLAKCPGIAETLDWAQALLGLGLAELNASPLVRESMRSCLLKTQDDQRALDDARLDGMVAESLSASAAT